MEGKPLTVYMVTALVLWALYLWRNGRLGKPALLPRPTLAGQPVQGPPPPGGWQPGAPPAGGQG